MKKYLLLLLVCFFTSVTMAQRPFEPTYLGTLPGLTLTLDSNTPNRLELEIPRPSENITTATSLYGPGQPRIESVGSTIVISVNTKILKLDIGMQSGNVIYEFPVDKWYNYKTKTYTTSLWDTNSGNGGWNQCYYELCISVMVIPDN